MKRSRLLGLLTVGHAFEHWYLGLLGPVMPFLAQDLGLSLTQVGILFTGRSVMSALSSAGTGLVMDALGGGKMLLVVCLAAIALVHGAVGLSPGFLVLAPIFWSAGLASHLWHPPSMGLLGTRFSDRRGFALGLHGTGASIGQSIAPLVAGYLLIVMSWRGVLLVNMIPLLLVSLLLAVRLPSFRPDGPGRGERGFSIGQVRTALLRNPALLSVAFMSGARTLAQNGLTIFLPFLLVRKFHAGPAAVGLALGIFTASSICPETIIGFVSDKVPRKLVIVAGMLVGGLAMLALPSAGDGPMLWALVALIGAFMVSLRSTVFAYAIESAPPRFAGSVVGLMFTVNQAFSGSGALLGGLLSDLYGPSMPFWCYGALLLLLLPLFLWVPAPPAAAAEQPLSPPEADAAPQTS